MDRLRTVLNPDFLVILVCGGWSPGPTPQRTWYLDPADCFQHQRSQRYPQRIIQNPTQLMLTAGCLNIKNSAHSKLECWVLKELRCVGNPVSVGAETALSTEQ